METLNDVHKIELHLCPMNNASFGSTEDYIGMNEEV